MDQAASGIAGGGRGVAAGVDRRKTLFKWLRRAATVLILVLGVLGAYGRRHELASGSRLLAHLHYEWLVVAVVLQMGSMVVFARMQRWLLRAGGVHVSLGPMLEITFAGNALGTSLPGGAAWAATWAFGQLRRRGADRILAGWVILVAGALSSFALFVIVAVGAWVAGSRGPVADLRPLAAGLAAIPVAAAVGVVASRRSDRVRRRLGAVWDAVRRHVPGAAVVGRTVANVIERLGTVQPGPLGWLEVFGLAMANWVDDAGTMAACLLALGLHVPWRSVLVIYGLTQIAASLPVTPGGLGVVEGSMSALLVAYGMPGYQAIAAVLLYRIVSFWGLVPIGWATWFALELAERGGVRARPHPWAEHRHDDDDKLRVDERDARGPERLRRPPPCEACPPGEEDDEAVGASASGAAGGSGG